MNENDAIHRLVGQIAEILEKRIILDDDDLHFINSTCGACSAEHIHKILNDPENSDHEMIRRLIFSPDETLQSELAPYAENIKPEQFDPDVLADHILNKTQSARVHLPKHKQFFCVSIDHCSVTRFLFLLNLDATIDPTIQDAMKRYQDRPFFWRAKVKIRNASVRFTEKQRVWMILFLTSVNCRADEFLDFLDFALEFVNDISDQTDMFRRLNDLKLFYYNALKQSGDYSVRLAQTNMETMIAMGNRPFYVDRHDAIKKIYIIDHLCADLYGRTGDIGDENNLFTIFTGSCNY